MMASGSLCSFAYEVTTVGLRNVLLATGDVQWRVAALVSFKARSFQATNVPVRPLQIEVIVTLGHSEHPISGVAAQKLRNGSKKTVLQD
jgi:hypothetical protein